MAFGCPVCNGFREEIAACRLCGHKMEDTGRLENAFDDYSPYRDIEHLRMTNAYLDLQAGECLHLFICQRCNHKDIRGISEEILG